MKNPEDTSENNQDSVQKTTKSPDSVDSTDASPTDPETKVSPVENANQENVDSSTEDTDNATQAKQDEKVDLEVQLKQQEDKFLRLLAEKDNELKRGKKDLTRERERGIEQVAVGLFEIADILEAALKEENDTVESIRKGISMTLDQLQKLMNTNGLVAIEPVEGDKLDPEQHNAIIQQEHATLEPKSIISTVLKGYRLNERVVRPAQVIVAKALESSEKKD